MSFEGGINPTLTQIQNVNLDNGYKGIISHHTCEKMYVGFILFKQTSNYGTAENVFACLDNVTDRVNN